MKIGIVSDTHDRHDMLAEALKMLQDEAPEMILHCGDITSPETVHLFAGTSTHFVFGNCDFDKGPLRAAIEEIGGEIHEPFGKLELDGRKIAWVHGDNLRLLHQLEHSGEHDFLFHGHTHVADQRPIGPTWVVNPGALHRANPKSCATLDLNSGEIKSLIISGL